MQYDKREDLKVDRSRVRANQCDQANKVNYRTTVARRRTPGFFSSEYTSRLHVAIIFYIVQLLKYLRRASAACLLWSVVHGAWFLRASVWCTGVHILLFVCCLIRHSPFIASRLPVQTSEDTILTGCFLLTICPVTSRSLKLKLFVTKIKKGIGLLHFLRSFCGDCLN